MKLYEVFYITMNVRNTDGSIEAEVEVVFSNIYGPDDSITPRGMGVRFLSLSEENPKFIAKEILQHLKSGHEKVDPKKLQTLQTLTIKLNENGSEAA